MSLSEEFVGDSYVFLLFVIEKEDLIEIFLAFVLVPSPYCEHYYQRFLVLSHFMFVNRFPFFKRTMVVRSD